jgi:predicted metalloprotease
MPKLTALFAFFCLASTAAAQSYQPADLALVQKKIPMAQSYFDTTWNNIFKSRGYNFSAPKLTTFVNSIDTPCGHFGKDNGMYCTKDRNVYIDAEFLATLVRNAANTLHTDGDYAAIVVAAHEYGHAVAAQLDIAFPNAGNLQTFDNEQVADCFAGVITRQAKKDGALEPGDFEEGVLSLESAGDDRMAGVNTSDALSRIIFMIKFGKNHGLSENREAAFIQGFYIGPEACSEKLGNPKYPPAAGVLLREVQVPNPQNYAGGSVSCTWHNTPAGNRVLNTQNAIQNSYCFLHLAKEIPPNVRIEVDVTREIDKSMDGGIFYSDGRAGIAGDPYAYQLTGFAMVDFISLNKPASLHGQNHIVRGADHNRQLPVGKPVHLTLDIHHQGQKLYALEFVNNYFVDVTVVAHPAPLIPGSKLGQGTDVAGLSAAVGLSGSAAVTYAHFSLSSLYE